MSKDSLKQKNYLGSRPIEPAVIIGLSVGLGLVSLFFLFLLWSMMSKRYKKT